MVDDMAAVGYHLPFRGYSDRRDPNNFSPVSRLRRTNPFVAGAAREPIRAPGQPPAHHVCSGTLHTAPFTIYTCPTAYCETNHMVAQERKAQI